MVSEISNLAITGYFNPAAPPQLLGSVVGLLYWYEGLAGWLPLAGTPPAVMVGTAHHLAIQWLNQSAEPISGHIDLTITRPDGTKVTLNDVLNQDSWAAPGYGWAVQFEPITLNKAGIYRATATLSTIGQVLGERVVDVAVVLPFIESSYIDILDIDGIGFASASGNTGILLEPTVRNKATRQTSWKLHWRFNKQVGFKNKYNHPRGIRFLLSFPDQPISYAIGYWQAPLSGDDWYYARAGQEATTTITYNWDEAIGYGVQIGVPITGRLELGFYLSSKYEWTGAGTATIKNMLVLE